MHNGLFIALIGLHQIVCWGTLTYGVTVLSAQMAARVGQPVSTIFTAYAFGLIFNGVVAPVCTRWVMRAGARIPGFVGLAVAATACVVLSFATTLPIMVFGFMLAGAAMALTQYDFAFLCVRLYQPSRARATVTGITLFGALASSIMWPVTQALAARWGMPGAWLGLAVIVVVVGAPMVWLCTRHPVVSATPLPVDGEINPPPREDVSPTRVRWLVPGLTIVSVMGGAVATNLPFVLARFDTPATTIPAVLSLFGIGQLCARMLDLIGSRRFGLDVTVRVAALASLGAWVLFLLPQLGLVTAAGVLLLGAGNGMFTIVRGTVPQLLFFGPQFTAVSATLASAGSYARAAAPMLLAMMLDHTKLAWPIALACASAIIIGAYAVLRYGQLNEHR
jgi:hypothetical protein